MKLTLTLNYNFKENFIFPFVCKNNLVPIEIQHNSTCKQILLCLTINSQVVSLGDLLLKKSFQFILSEIVFKGYITNMNTAKSV